MRLKYNKHWLIFLSLIILNSALIVTGNFFAQQNVAEKKIAPQINRTRFYLYPPQPESYFPNAAESYQPFVRTKPDSIFYPVAYFYEERDRASQKYPLLFLAEKRVREIEEWKNSLDIIHDNSSTNAAELKKWWLKSRPELSDLKDLSVLKTYEAEIARYESLVSQKKDEIKKISSSLERIQEYGLLRAFIKSGHLRMQEAVKNSKYGDGDKKYLNDLIFNSNKQLIESIKNEYPQFNPSQVRYPLEEIHSMSQYGEYNITLEWPEGTEKIAENSEIVVEGDDAGSNTRINISKHIDAVSVKLPNLEIIGSLACGASQFIYPYPEMDKYLLSIEHTAEVPVQYNIKQTSGTQIKNIFDRMIGKENKLDTDNYSIFFPKNQEALYELRAGDGMTDCSRVSQIKVSAKPVILPVLILDKVNNSIALASTKQESTYYRYFLRFASIIKFLTIIYIFTRIPSALKFMTVVLNTPPAWIRKGRILFAAIFILGFIADTFLITKSSELIIFIVFLSYVFTVVTYRINLLKQAYLSAVLLALVPVLYLMQKNVAADKIGVWAFLVILTTFIQIYFNKKNEVRDNFIDNLVHDIKMASRIKQISRYAAKTKNIAATHIKDYLGGRPKKPAEYIIFVWKLLLLFCAFVALIYITYSTYIFLDNKIENYKSRKVLEKRTPTVLSYGPSVAYRGTKIILHGREFDWKEYNNVKLMSTYGEVTTDIWTDTKIIFRLPYEWRDGRLQIWIEKPMLWNDGWYSIKSDPVDIKVIPVTGSFTKDDEKFYEQMKKLDEETRRINGY